ncbi:MAG TPA: ABC transporter permease [Bryobacteraceae bacterium]|jgi:predicted permease|nr:ABC transporter permease [Bryobacteraceae bacterium]
MRRTNHIETIWNDLRYAVRTLGRTPGFTIVIVLTLALSIGANSAIFSVIQGVLLRPLPFAQPDRLVRVYFQSDSQPKFPLNPNDFRDFRERTRTFESIAAMTRHDVQLSGTGADPIMLRGFDVTAGYFHALGLSPARGRDFTTDDELAERWRLAILSDRLWRSRFSADPNILGRKITLNTETFTIVGVMPPGAQHPGNNFQAVADGDTVDLWMPFFLYGSLNDRGSHYLDAIGRLKPGATQSDANADLSSVLEQLKKEHTGRGWRIYTIPLYQETVGRSKRMLLVLLGAVGLLLLIACVNAANLLLARSSARVREIAVRSALGAARGRIVRQLLTESLVIAFAGAALGTLLAYGGVRVLVSFLPADFPRASAIRLDATVFGFTLVVAILTGLLFGLVPALTASRTDLQNSLRESGRSTTGSTGQLRLRNFLVVGETGLACVLLIAAGLMLHSFVNLLSADPGFEPQQVLTASLSLPYQSYREIPRRVEFYQRLIANLEALPGVQYAGGGTDLPWTGYDGNADGYKIEGRSDEYNDKTTARYHVATPDYFRALGIPLAAGRFFDGREDKDGPYVIIINETMANRYWRGENAIGKRISFRSRPREKDWMQIIGIVRDVKDEPNSTSNHPAFWMPHSQQTERNLFIVMRSSSDPATLANQFRLAVRQLDPELAVADLRTMNQISGTALSTQRFSLFLVGLFALLALVLATFGMYGVISYSVNQRMHEFGLRMALGARPSDLLRLILGQGLALSIAGAAAGLICAAGLTKLLGSLLYGVSPTDPLTFSAVAVLALATTTLASYLPARRAADADPMHSLRAE